MTPAPRGGPRPQPRSASPAPCAPSTSKRGDPRRLWSRLCLLAATPLAAAKVEIKLATAIPANTPFTKLLDDLNKEWQTISGGDVSMVIYPGGVQGDESDVIRKIRIGQLHAAAITVASLSDLDDYFSVFQIPLFFESWDELNYVLDDVTPLLADRLDQKGYQSAHLGPRRLGVLLHQDAGRRASTICASSRSSPGPATTA